MCFKNFQIPIILDERLKRTLILIILKTQIALGFQPYCDELSLFNEKCFKFNIFTLEVTSISVTNYCPMSFLKTQSWHNESRYWKNIQILFPQYESQKNSEVSLTTANELNNYTS